MTLSQEARPPSEWRLHWKLLLACVAGIMLSSAQSYTLGVMIGPLEEEFGWSRAQISTGPLVLAVIALFAAPMLGLAVDRFGPRRIGLFGVVIFCAAIALFSTTTADLLSWWLRWGLLALAAMAVAPLVWTAAVASSFDKNRGLALAIALCGTGIGSALLPRLTNDLVAAYGWRNAYIGIALILAVIVLPLVLFLFRSGADGGRARAAKAQTNAALPGVSVRAGLASMRFLKLTGASTIISFAVCALIANAVPILISHGLTRTDAASVAGLVGIGAIIGRLCGGYLVDRLNANLVAAACVLAPIVTAVLLIFAPGSIAISSVAYLILGLAVGTELDACAYLATRHFGLRSFGALFGVMNGLMIFANGIAPLAANSVYDATQSYEHVLWGVIPLCLISSLLFASLGRYPSFEETSPDPACAPASAEGKLA